MGDGVMSAKLAGLEALIKEISDYATKQLELGNISGPRYQALLKLIWCGSSGEPCYSTCEAIVEALEKLREVEDDEELNAHFIAITASMLDIFPQGAGKLSDFDELRKISAQIGNVSELPINRPMVMDKKTRAA